MLGFGKWIFFFYFFFFFNSHRAHLVSRERLKIISRGTRGRIAVNITFELFAATEAFVPLRLPFTPTKRWVTPWRTRSVERNIALEDFNRSLSFSVLECERLRTKSLDLWQSLKPQSWGSLWTRLTGTNERARSRRRAERANDTSPHRISQSSHLIQCGREKIVDSWLAE